MIKIIELRKSINTLLKSVHPRAYYEEAPEDAVYPYIVYLLPNSLDDGSLEQFVLDVDGWDNNSDTTELETLMYNVDQVLHKKSVVVDALAFTIYRDNRLALTDDDPRIRRRKYIYQVRTYEGG